MAAGTGDGVCHGDSEQDQTEKSALGMGESNGTPHSFPHPSPFHSTRGNDFPCLPSYLSRAGGTNSPGVPEAVPPTSHRAALRRCRRPILDRRLPLTCEKRDPQDDTAADCEVGPGTCSTDTPRVQWRDPRRCPTKLGPYRL